MGTPKNQTVRIPFSMARLRALRRPDKGRVYVHDSRQPGLTLCITANDTRTFYVYRWLAGRPVRIRLGRFPEVSVETARKAARQLIGEMAEGRDPQAARVQARRGPTVGDLFEHYLAYAELHTKTPQEARRLYDKFLKPWAKKKLSSLSRPDVRRLHSRIGADHGPYAANRVIDLLRAAFNRASNIGYEGPNPAVRVERFPEQKRDRFLSGDEIRRFFDALALEEPLFRDFFTLALLTGARRGNLQAMRWEDVNLDQAVWRIPGPDSKSGQPILVPLTKPAVDILRSRLGESNSSPYVFPTRSKTGHLTEPKSAWKRICAAAGLRDVRIHDLRRTLASWQATLGASLPIIGRSLGHADGSPATAVYARLDLTPVRASVEAATVKMLAYRQGEENKTGTETAANAATDAEKTE